LPFSAVEFILSSNLPTYIVSYDLYLFYLIAEFYFIGFYFDFSRCWLLLKDASFYGVREGLDLFAESEGEFCVFKGVLLLALLDVNILGFTLF